MQLIFTLLLMGIKLQRMISMFFYKTQELILTNFHKKQSLEGAINRKLIAKKAIDDGIEKDPQYKEAIAKIKEDLALQVWQKNEIDKIKFSDTEKRAFYDTNKSQFNIPETFESFHILLNSEAEANAVIKH